MSLYSSTVDACRPSAPLASSEHVHGPVRPMAYETSNGSQLVWLIVGGIVAGVALALSMGAV